MRFFTRTLFLVVTTSILLSLIPQSAIGAQVTSFLLTSGMTGTLPFTLGLGFKKGDVTGAPGLDIQDYQVTVKKRWNDNTVKHAIVSGHVFLSANNPRSINVLASGSPSSGQSLTAANIQAANPSVSVRCGTIGTVNLSDLLTNPFRTWISGPEMVEVHYQSSVGIDNLLSVWFHVRLYKNGHMWVRVIVENGYINVSRAIKSYVPTIIIDKTVVYNNGGNTLSHYGSTRYMAEGWIGGDPGITPQHDTTYLMQSNLVPNYWKRNPSSSTLNSLTQTYTPMGRGNLTQSMGDAGYQQQIGLLPLWDALYITTGDARAYRSVLANSSHLNSYPVVWRDSNTNLVAKPSDWPNYSLATFNLSAGPLTWEMAHSPSEGYLAYLLTGDFWHYETALLHAALSYVARSSTTGTGVNRILLGETRAFAWNVRNVSHAVALAPTDDAVTADYQTLLTNNIIWLANRKNLNGMNELGSLYQYSMGAWGETGSVAPWMTDFLVMTMGMGSDIEPLSSLSNWNQVRDWMYRWPIGRLGPSGSETYCFTRAAQYGIAISNSNDTNPTTWFDSWGDVYTATFGYPNTSCENTLLGGSASAPSMPNGYWGNLLPAIAYAVDHNATGALEAWNRLAGATNFANFENSGFDDIPIWGIVPRGLSPEVKPPLAPRNLRVQ
jgi:hypothetical protein